MLTPNQEKDIAYNWHPYTQHKISHAPVVISKGKDALLWDEHGNEYIDAIGSWWANPHGHANKQIADAITAQINTLEHVLFGGYTHPSAIQLSEKLLSLLPHFGKVFYSDNGSTAVEVALKMALQYFLNQGIKKNVCVALEGGFHGDTFGAMSVSGIGLFTESLEDVCLPVERIPVPNPKNWEEVQEKFTQIVEKNNVYAFIFEPLVQGANGMTMYEPKHLDALITIAKQHNVVVIADEVMTGFGRTGKLFATQYLTQTPDIMCMSKALTGGFIPLSATLATQKIFNAFYNDDVGAAFFHGHTFMANPAGCAAALASIKISTSEETERNINRIQQQYTQFQKKIEEYPTVTNVRNLGVIFAFDIKTQGENSYYGNLRNQLYDFYFSHQLIVRPVKNTIYFLPPFCITNTQLQKVFEVTYALLEELRP